MTAAVRLGVRRRDSPTMNSNHSDQAEAGLVLSIIVTIVSGKESIRANLLVLAPQIDFDCMEVIVPYDNWSEDIGELAAEFPDVTFHFFGDLGNASPSAVRSDAHWLYDKRRALGLNLCRGSLIAMTEDQGIPAHDWVRSVLLAHEQPYEVIGGAVENGVESTINRAVYYSDFGRYGLPFEPTIASYVTDVNVTYKRGALMDVKDVWIDGYQETSVHWEMLARGKRIYLDNRLVVFQVRPLLKLESALKERIAWGRVFARTRAKAESRLMGLLFLAGSMFLPIVLLGRVAFHLGRRTETPMAMVATLAVGFLLAIGWSVGEFLGYLFPHVDYQSTRPPTNPK